MTQQIYRQEILEAQAAKESDFSAPIVAYPKLWKWMLCGVLLFLLCFAVFMSFVELSRIEKAQGQLRFTKAESKMYAEKSGVIKEVHITEGDHVEVGQVLFSINIDQNTVDNTTLNSNLSTFLDSETATLIKAKKLALNKAKLATDEIVYLREANLQKIEKANQKRALLLSQKKRAQSSYQRANTAFEADLIGIEQLYQAKDALDSANLNLLDLDSSLSEAQLEMDKLHIEKTKVKAEQQRETNRIDQAIAQLARQRSTLQANTHLVIKASISGHVGSLSVKEGQTVRADDFMAVITPTNSELVAELFLPSKAIAFVESGQRVKFKFEAFPFQKYGIATGKLTSISKTGILSSDLGVIESEPFLIYRARAELDIDSLTTHLRRVRLQSGMKLEAQIVLEKRTLLKWLQAVLFASAA